MKERHEEMAHKKDQTDTVLCSKCDFTGETDTKQACCAGCRLGLFGVCRAAPGFARVCTLDTHIVMIHF